MTSPLRDQALAIMPAELGLTPTRALPNVCAAVMELGFEGGVATLVAVADGTASLYFSNGGGIIGAGRHDKVRAAAARFLVSAERSLGALAAAADQAAPLSGHARFFVRTYVGLMTAAAPGEELAGGGHPLSALFFQGHDLVTAIRDASGEDANG
ncbi:MAG TPA: hypothetical protein VGI92_05970 [Gemmatimonadales bacterium]|jgi:hypothetical protein